MEIKFLKKKKKFKKESFKIVPDIYWRYILFTTVFLILLFCIFGLNFFIKISNESTAPVININEQEIVKKESLNLVLESFKEREKKSNEILNSPSPILDPSL